METSTEPEEAEVLNATLWPVLCSPTLPSNVTCKPYGDVWTPAAIQRVATLCVIMAMTLVGNGIILATLTCSRYRVRTGRTSCRVHIFIVNLAIGDLAVCCVTMTGELIFVVCGEWVLGAVGCKLIVYGEIVALASTIFILLAMSYDRYLAICQPLRFKNSMSRARRTIGLAWVLALIIAVPQLFVFVQVQEGVRPDGRPVFACKSRGYTAWWQRRLYLSCLTVCILVVPAAVITFCYVSIVRVVWRQGKQQTVVASSASVISLRKTGANDRQLSRAKVRTVNLTLCIIVAFVACWTPYFVVHNLRIHSDYRYRVAEPVLVFAETIALFNSALNPIVYGCFNLRVKKALHDSCCHRLRRRPYPGAERVPGSTHSGYNRANATSDYSSSIVDDTTTVVHVTNCSPSSSGKLRVNYNRINGNNVAAVLASSADVRGQHDGECTERRSRNCCAFRSRGPEMFELKQRPKQLRRESRP